MPPPSLWFPPWKCRSLTLLLRKPTKDNRKILPALPFVHHLLVETERLCSQRRRCAGRFGRVLRQSDVLGHQRGGESGGVVAVGRRGGHRSGRRAVVGQGPGV